MAARRGERPRAPAERPRPSSEHMVGVLERHGRHLVATPFFGRGRRLNVERHPRAREGALALVAPASARSFDGRVVRVIGRPDVARDVIEALMLDRGLRRRFDPFVERSVTPLPVSLDGRTDLRSLPTFTIDPPTARDFDDAISARVVDGGTTRLWVHIADVSAHVRPGSPVDREAMRRGTSVYVPGAVEPMLPEALSNDACSLVPGAERLTVTVEMDFRGAERVRTAFYRSVIVSDKRLSYPEVDEIFAGVARAAAPWGEPLSAARAVSAALDAARRRRGALAVESAEPEFAFDRGGHVTGFVLGEQTESHRLIEHLMIAANESVAALLETRKLPTLYRIHEQPDAARVSHLAAQLGSLDVQTPPLPDVMTPQQAADAVGEISLLVEEHLRRSEGRGRRALTSLLLRSLKQAAYSPVNRGHAGLQSPRYCHFTSPIRRYPDLVAHRALLAAVGADEDPVDAGGLERLGAWCSGRERDAMTIERDADDVVRCFLLERSLFETGLETEFDGEVIGLIGAGAFVAFGDGHEGMLPARRMRGDWWELNELGTMLVGAESGTALRLGDAIRVGVERIDAPRGRVELRPAAAV